MVHFSTQARIALRSLLPKDRTRVTEAARRLDRPPRSWADRADVKRLSETDGRDLYVLRAGPDLRVLFERTADEGVVVLDVFTQDRFTRLREPAV